jgi:hypothetical protein
MRPADTSPEAWKVFLDLQRRMTPGEKIARAFEWSEIVRGFTEAGLRERYPAANDREILLRYARLTMGDDLFRRAYGNALADESSGTDTQDAR